VAFKVHFSSSGNIIQTPIGGYPFKFDSVIFNDGQAYSPQTGVFTTPVSGVYTFAIQIFNTAAQRQLLDIMVNGNIASRMGMDTHVTGGDPQDSGMTAVIIKLVQGDRVWVQQADGYNAQLTIFATIHTFFDGALLYAIMCIKW
jgi:hypothetical protein